MSFLPEVRLMTAPRLGRVQLKIMQVLWQRGRANAREITEALCRAEPIAHSTVQTLLRKLEAKGAVAHEVQDRTFVFYALVKQEQVKRGAVRDLVNRVFDRSAAELVSYLLENERVPRDELERIRKLIDRRQRKEG
jgi:BlaI family transcriptional regulator, penicillinase repressor